MLVYTLSHGARVPKRRNRRFIALDLCSYMVLILSIVMRRTIFEDFKRKELEKYIEEISGLFAGNAITEMPMLPGEIRGIGALSNFAKIMYGDRL